MNTGPLRVYGLVRLTIPADGEAPKVKGGVEILPYELVGVCCCDFISTC